MINPHMRDTGVDPGFQVRGGANGLQNLKKPGEPGDCVLYLYKYISNTVMIIICIYFKYDR